MAGCEAVSLVCVGILCLRGGGEFEPVFAESAPDCFSERINNSALILYFTFYFCALCVMRSLDCECHGVLNFSKCSMILIFFDLKIYDTIR